MATTAGAAAGGWKGAHLQWQYYDGGGPVHKLGSPGECDVEKNKICGTFRGYFNIITYPKAITFDYSESGNGSYYWGSSELSLPPTIYNGVAINLLSSGTIKSVKIDPATNMVGFDETRISFTAKQIQVDWQDLPFDSSTIVKLDVKVNSAAQATLSPMSIPLKFPQEQ